MTGTKVRSYAMHVELLVIRHRPALGVGGSVCLVTQQPVQVDGPGLVDPLSLPGR
jgi:hypothetical protein